MGRASLQCICAIVLGVLVHAAFGVHLPPGLKNAIYGEAIFRLDGASAFVGLKPRFVRGGIEEFRF